MEADFWHQRWQQNQIGFHASEPNPFLLEYFRQLGLAKGARVFLPLCGKTLDIGWLLAQGYQVVGAELSELAISQLFADLGVVPEIAELAGHKHYRFENLDIFVGDLFDLSAEILGPVDAIYDRAALVALPAAMRANYSAQLRGLSDNAPQLLICFEYEQSQMDGPPFAVWETEVQALYAEYYQLQKLACVNVQMNKQPDATIHEVVWLLQKRDVF